MNYRKVYGVVALGMCLSVGSSALPVFADEPLSEHPAAGKEFQWNFPGGRYVDPTSFFSLHGYVDGIYGSSSREWTAPDPTQIGGPGQVLVSNTSRSSFQYDAALFIGSEISAKTRALLEMHLVSDPGGVGAAGPGGLTLVMTEATASWDLVPQYLTLSGGLFWAPFGIVNQDWLGAQNLFTLLPRASGAFPNHWNERGIRINGSKAFTENSGMNYVFSYGNGLSTFDIGGQSNIDADENKNVMGRIGFFPGLGNRLDIGYSFSVGTLRDTGNTALALNNPLRYKADAVAHGLDLTARMDAWTLRSYYITSVETLDPLVGDVNPDDLNREGFMAEVSYKMPVASSVLKYVMPKLRYDRADIVALTTGGSAQHYRSNGYAMGVSLYPEERFYLSLEYHLQDELGRTELSNNRFVGKLTAMF